MNRGSGHTRSQAQERLPSDVDFDRPTMVTHDLRFIGISIVPHSQWKETWVATSPSQDFADPQRSRAGSPAI